MKNRAQVKKKIDIALQQWERHRRPDTDENPQQEDRSLGSLFKDVLVSEKPLSIDVTLNQERHLQQTHILQALELLATIYPEVKKVKKLAGIIMQSEGENWIPSEIKIPVVSSLGIKAVVKIEDIDYTTFTAKQELQTFHTFYEGYQNLDLMGAGEFQEM